MSNKVMTKSQLHEQTVEMAKTLLHSARMYNELRAENERLREALLKLDEEARAMLERDTVEMDCLYVREVCCEVIAANRAPKEEK